MTKDMTRATTEIDRMVGERIRARRWMLGLTQADLATRVGVSFQQIQKNESGTSRIAASRLWDIAQVLDVPIGHFFPEE
jgi:Predicted transcriptional regulators